MYCPKCSAENETGQKYCRKCGLPLTVVQFALNGRVDDSLAQYKKGGDVLFGGTLALVLCLLAAIINMILIPGPWNGYVVLANSIVGLLIALPMIISGRVRLSRANRLLNSAEPLPRLNNTEPASTSELLPPAAVTDPLVSPVANPGSVTEGTTLNLKSPEVRPRQR